MQQYITQINRIIYTLNLVNVHGRENLDSLLASIQALEEMQNVMETEVKEAKREEVKKRAAENKQE